MAITLIACLSGCADRAEPPPYHEILVLEGDAYERGFQHGEQLSSKIRSLYTVLLETSLLPYLNREQGDVMLFLEEYQKPEYQDGKFSYEMLLQSGQNLEEIMEETHPEYVEEMKGIADGSGIPYDRILVLNTFVDTMLAFRSVTLFIRQLQAPRILQVDFLGSLDSDGIDNNGDGLTDEEDDGTVKEHLYRDVWSTEYAPRPQAAMVEVPVDARIRLVLHDQPGLTGFKDPDGEQKEGEELGMDPESIRLQLGEIVYTAEDACIQTTTWGEGEEDNGMEVIFTPPGGLPPAEEISLIVQAGNLSRIVTPPPVHARFMRDERIVFSTRGLGKRHHEVPNLGEWDGRNMPTALGFAVRESATPDQHLRMAHHFALLDSNTSHKHTVMLVHRPDDGKAHVTLGWAGLVWGFSGMNEDGLTYMVNYSDTLDNPFAGQVRLQVWMAKLLCTGIPVGVKGRRMLDHLSTVDQAVDMLRGEESTFGWNFLLGDARRNMAVVELDNNILDEDDGGALVYDPDVGNPENLDANGSRYASEGPDDLRIASHFVKNVPDIDTTILIFDVQPQRYWSSFYYRSLRTFFSLAERIESRYGSMNTDEMVEILRTPALVDLRDSMNAVVYEPEDLKLRFSMGQVPATDGEFIDFDLGAALTEGGSF